MIDYKGLAGRIKCLADYTESDPAWDAAETADLRTVVSLLEGMEEEKPFAWAVRDTNPVFPEPGLWMLLQQANEPRVSWVHHEKMPLYLHPAPQPQPVLSGYSDYGAAIPGIERPCTCHPDDNPPAPCAQQYALNECRAAQPERQQKCGCRSCLSPIELLSTFVVCPVCGCKRCPRADDHRNDCTSDNVPQPQPERQPASEPTEAQIELPNIVKTAPERIYLVIGEDCHDDATFSGDGVTWCADKIDDNSIPYVRADRAALAAKE